MPGATAGAVTPLVDVPTLIKDIVAVVQGNAGTLWENIKEGATSQAKAIATQTKNIAVAELAGDLDRELRSFFQEQLKDMILSLVRFTIAKTVATLEATWNAIVKLVWGAVDSAVSIALGKIPLDSPPSPS